MANNEPFYETYTWSLGYLRVKIMQSEQYEQSPRNGLEETICSAKITSNINDAERADFFNPQAGWTTHLNSFKLPILEMVQLSAERGVLNKVSD